MQITVDRVILEALFKHAAPAAHLVGHLDDGVPDPGLGPPGDIGVTARDGIELIGDARLVVARARVAAPHDRVSQGAAPTLMSGAGGGR